MSQYLICVSHLAGHQWSHFQPRLHHRSGVPSSNTGGRTLLASRMTAGLSTWTAFFKLPEGGFRTVGKIPSEDECKRYIGAFKDDIPTACRQLAQPDTCPVACVKPVASAPPAAKPVGA